MTSNEPNDRVDQAWRTLQPGGRYTAYLYDGDPDDWYCLDLAAGQHVVINLAVPPEVDFDLYLYRDAPLVLVNRSDATGNGVGEYIAYTATQAEHCYVRVHPYRGASFKPYTLQLGA